jgi:anti-sigma factor RsiW
MKNPLEEELLLKRFLLGELSQSEQSEVEERLFADPQYFSQFRAAEDELIDEYLYGDLDGSEQERFEKYFVTTPERRESLRVARALQQYIVKKGPSAATEFADKVSATRSAKRTVLDILGISGNALRFSMAAAVILIVAVAVWLVVRSGQNNPVPLNAGSTNVQPSPEQIAQGGPGQNQSNQNNGVQPREGNRNGDGGKDAGNSRPPRRPSARYSFLILPIPQVRGEGGVNKITLPADAGIVNLKVPLIEGGYDTYRLVLQTNSEKVVKSWSNLKPANEDTGQTLSVDISVQSLRQQKFRLALSGVSNNGNPRLISTFYFQVTRLE